MGQFVSASINAGGCNGPGKLRLYQSANAGLAGLILECRSCQASQPMEGAFGKETMDKLGVGCEGWQPWLTGTPTVDCDEIPRAMQRGASNTYFPVVASALAIPPFTEALQEMLNPYWPDFLAQPQSEWPMVIKYGNLESKLGTHQGKDSRSGRPLVQGTAEAS